MGHNLVTLGIVVSAFIELVVFIWQKKILDLRGIFFLAQHVAEEKRNSVNHGDCLYTKSQSMQRFQSAWTF